MRPLRANGLVAIPLNLDSMRLLKPYDMDSFRRRGAVHGAPACRSFHQRSLAQTDQIFLQSTRSCISRQNPSSLNSLTKGE